MLALIIAALIVAAAGTLAFGHARWHARTDALHARLRDAQHAAARASAHAAAPGVVPSTYDARAIAALPAPVQRYFRAALRDGQPLIASVRIAHAGTFNARETAEAWRPFRSSQLVTIQPPGFVWDARVAMAPGVSVRVHDAYVGGEGILHAEVLGLVTVASMRGTREAAEGELMRYLAEAVWYPTALLPSALVRWDAIDEQSARATLRDGHTSVSLDFHFGADGTVERVSAPARPRTVRGATVPTPWEGRFRSYAEREGMRIPLEGEVAWMLPEGELPYWRGRIVRIAYEWEK
ncbi:MAG TPA: DUF6544 family protein [Gemmatimonadaceae bacterium]|nr:DUF6544 family protein [Gemmatimonadaceae bacterium]